MSVQTSPASPSAGPPLRSASWRDGSRAVHEAAEGSAFVVDLVAGRATAAAYVAYLQRLRGVYAALEAALDEHRDHPVVAAVHDPALRRLDALDADLRHWSAGGEPSTAPVGSPAVGAYVQRLQRACRAPHLLVAHHYTRYLGDLSGGQVLARALRTGFPDRGLDAGGLAFYAFDDIAAVVPWKRAYRERLDALDLDPEEDGAMLAEVREAFRLNHALLDEVAGPDPDSPDPDGPGGR